MAITRKGNRVLHKLANKSNTATLSLIQAPPGVYRWFGDDGHYYSGGYSTQDAAVAAARNGVLFREPKTIVFGVIGDFGKDSAEELSVARLVKSWAPNFVLTLGDNNYTGTPNGVDAAVGKYYREFIHPYTGSQPLTNWAGDSAFQRFFPTFGNHDLDGDTGTKQISYFSLPEGRRYYDFVAGDVHFFVLDSGLNTAGTLVEPDGNASNSVQAQWLTARLALSHSRLKVVTFHHPAYTSASDHGPTVAMRWDFPALGVKLAMSGHNHTYERIVVNGVTYLVNGIGGNTVRGFGAPIAQSVFRYNADFGAVKGTITPGNLTMQLYSRANQLIDTFSL